jgi:uncharacterized protein (DUF302 family)
MLHGPADPPPIKIAFQLTSQKLIEVFRKAEKVGLKMHPTDLIIFGSPKGGTPVMITSPAIATDLPLKALIWQDAGGKVWVSYNSPEYLQQRHSVPAKLVKNISSAGLLLQMAVK